MPYRGLQERVASPVVFMEPIVPFKSKEELGGEVDPNIYRGGRNPSEKEKKTNKELGRQELIRLFRKFKPHLANAIDTATKIMVDSEANENARLRAAAMIIAEYKTLVSSIYGDVKYEEEQEANEEEVSSTPVFRLKLVDKEEPQE